MSRVRGFGIRAAALVAVGLAALFAIQCGTDDGPDVGELVISPSDAVVQASSGQLFSADVDGVQKTVSWYVNGVQGGTPETGLITTDGFYIAPSAVPNGGGVTLRALAVADTMLEGFATVAIEREDGAVYVTVAPDTVTLMAGEAIDFSGDVFECSTDSVVWSVGRLWGSSSTLGTISSSGLYQPPPSFNNDFAVAVRATSFDCPGKIGLAKVLVYVGPQAFSAQMEGYTSSYDAPGSVAIASASCGGAHGGLAVKGLDTAGEWVSIAVEVPSAGTYQAFLRYQAKAGDVLQAVVSMEGAGDPTPEASFVLDDGDGLA
jgi:hypothetical protein